MKLRQHEFVLPADFPTSRRPGWVDRTALTEALLDLERMEVGDAVRLPITPEDLDRLEYVTKIAHTYNERLGCRMEIQTRIRDGWLYLRKKTDEPRRTLDGLRAELRGEKKRKPLAEVCLRNEIEREKAERRRA